MREPQNQDLREKSEFIRLFEAIGSRIKGRSQQTAFLLLLHWSKASPMPFPGVERLSEFSGLDRTTIMRDLRALEDQGVRVIRSKGKGSRYDLSSLLQPVASCDQSEDATGRELPPEPVASCDQPVASCDPKRPNNKSKGREPRAPSPKRSSARMPLEPIPDDWAPLDRHRAKAKLREVDIDVCARSFRGHALSIDRRCADWSSAFDDWVEKQHPEPKSKTDDNVWDMGPDDFAPTLQNGARKVRNPDGSLVILTP